MGFVIGMRAVGYTQSKRRFPAFFDSSVPTTATDAIARDGSRPPTAAQPWNTQNLLGVGQLSVGQAGAPAAGILAEFATTTIGEGIVSGNAFAGVWANANNFATFSHSSQNTASNYCLMQSSVGGTILNGVTTLLLRHLNVTKSYISAIGVGIGPTAPSDLFHVAAAGNANALRVENSVGTVGIRTAPSSAYALRMIATGLTGGMWMSGLDANKWALIFTNGTNTTGAGLMSDGANGTSLTLKDANTTDIYLRTGGVSYINTGFAFVIGRATDTAGTLQVSSAIAAAETVLSLEQLDIDDSFIDFVGTSAADATRSISEPNSDTSMLRQEVNGTTRWSIAADSPDRISGAISRYAEIYVQGGAVSQAITTGGTYEKFIGFTTDAASNGMTAAAASDKITVTQAGHYEVKFQISFSGTNSSTVDFRINWNGVAQNQLHCKRKLGTGGDVGSCSMVGIIDATAATTDIEVWFTTDGNGDNIVAVDAQLTATWLGST